MPDPMHTIFLLRRYQETCFSSIRANLFTELITSALITQQRYASLYKPSDPEWCDPDNFRPEDVACFRGFICTSAHDPPESLLQALTPVWVTTEEEWDDDDDDDSADTAV